MNCRRSQLRPLAAVTAIQLLVFYYLRGYFHHFRFVQVYPIPFRTVWNDDGCSSVRDGASRGDDGSSSGGGGGGGGGGIGASCSVRRCDDCGIAIAIAINIAIGVGVDVGVGVGVGIGVDVDIDLKCFIKQRHRIAQQGSTRRVECYSSGSNFFVFRLYSPSIRQLKCSFNGHTKLEKNAHMDIERIKTLDSILKAEQKYEPTFFIELLESFVKHYEKCFELTRGIKNSSSIK
uniref:Uncharacterized protein n=1 Tax=Glossina austeni TaxID=7395 RepID=A0A1A9VEL4_GLOAU